MKKRLQLLSLIVILSFAILTQLSVKPASAVSLTRDLVVSSGEYLEIVSEEWDIDGNIIVEKDATLVLTNALINIKGAEEGHMITFTDATLIVQNATITSDSKTWFPIYFQGASNVTALELNVKYGLLNFQDSTTAKLTKFNYATKAPFPPSSLTVQDSSIVTISNSTIMEPPLRGKSLVTKGSANVSLYDSQIWDLDARETSQVSLSQTGLLWALNIGDSSKVTVVGSLKDWISKKIPLATTGVVTAKSSALTVNNTIMRKANAYDSSSISVFNTTMQDAVVNAYNSSIISLAKLTMRGTAVAPTIVAYQASKITIVNSEIRDISTVGVYGTAEITIQGSKLRELGILDQAKATVSNSQLSGLSHISGSASASFSNSEIEILQSSDSSSLSISNSEIQELESYDTSQASVSGSNVTLLRSSDSSTVTITDSMVREVFLYFRSINASISNLNPSVFESWDSLDVALIGVGGYAPNVTLTRTTVQLGWGFWFFGSSNVTINDSTIESIGVSDTSTVWLTNSTLISDPSAMTDGLVYVYWYLNVYSVAGADISVWYPNGTLTKSEVADTDGLARFTLLEKTVGSSGADSVGNYKVVATWNGASTETTMELTSSKKLMFTSPVPWWQEFWYLIVLVAIAIVAISSGILIRRRGTKKLT
jgi:hypothetical protein